MKYSSEDEMGTGMYEPVDAIPEPDGQNSPKKKKIVRYYNGINPEVEAELQKVIEELQQKGVEKVKVFD